MSHDYRAELSTSIGMGLLSMSVVCDVLTKIGMVALIAAVTAITTRVVNWIMDKGTKK